MTTGQLYQYHHHYITSDLGQIKAAAKYPHSNNDYYIATNVTIYHLNVHSQNYTKIASTPGSIADIELVTTNNLTFLAIADRKNNCIRKMNTTTFFISGFLGECKSPQGKYLNPYQLSYDELSHVLYLAVTKNSYFTLIAYYVDQNKTAELGISDKRLDFSCSSPYTLILHNRESEEIFLVKVIGRSGNVTTEEDLLVEGVQVKSIAQVRDTLVYVNSKKLWTNDKENLCVYKNSECSSIENVNFVKQIGYTKVFVYTESREIYILGEVDTTTTAITATTAPPTRDSTTSQNALTKPTATTHCQAKIINRNHQCNGRRVNQYIGTSVEACAYICIKSKHCLVFTYDSVKNYCSIYQECYEKSLVAAEHVDSYIIQCNPPQNDVIKQTGNLFRSIATIITKYLVLFRDQKN